jgi:UDP-hydrolysing UDP-N-acetyl-D-glucosamine 2-epimerase
MNRVHYARQKHLLALLKSSPNIELQVVVGGSVLLDRYGRDSVLPAIEKDFEIKGKFFNTVDGGTHIAMAKTAGLTALEFSNAIHELDPDVVLIRGDRFEQLAIAMSAAYLNKTIAHIEGGEVTGTIDESVRHAITKLAHIHFVTSGAAKQRVLQMGEDPKKVFEVGSPDIEYAAKVKRNIDTKYFNSKIGIGPKIDFNKPYLMVIWHPVTTEGGNAEKTEELLKAIDDINIQTIWFWPNNDAGTDEIAGRIRRYRENHKLKNNKIRFVIDVHPADFSMLLRKTSVLVGNSSSGFKEAAYFGIPVVNVGNRQAGRFRTPNIIDVEPAKKIIKQAIAKQLSKRYYPSFKDGYKPNTSKRIVELLVKNFDYYQKKFNDP